MNTRIVVPAGEGRAVEVRRGQPVAVVNTHGSQVVDFWAISLPDLDAWLSMEHTRVVTRRLTPRVGDTLVSNLRQPLLTVVSDTSPGVHDTLIAACDPERYRQLGAAAEHRSCRQNYEEALAAIGRSGPPLPAPFNLFMNIPWNASGDLEWLPTVSRPGDAITFRAERDVIAIASSCPMDIVPINGPGGAAAVDVELVVG